MSFWSKSTFVALGAVLLLGGCQASDVSRLSSSSALRQAARSYLVGTTYDQALIAARENNGRRLRDAMRRLQSLKAADVSGNLQLRHAEQLVRDAQSLDIQAAQSPDPKLRTKLSAESAHKYRAALRWAPAFPSQDPLLLNALGYFLADRGTTEKDFLLAAQLTSNAVAMLSQRIADNEQIGVSDSNWMSALKRQQALTRDSHAWALYRLERFNQAEAAQRKALKQAKSSGLTNRPALAELWGHLAKILQAQGETAEAKQAEEKSEEFGGKK